MSYCDRTGPRYPVLAYAQYQANTGNSRPSMPTTIWAKNPTSPKTPYAVATRRVAEDGSATVSQIPSADAMVSEASDAPACRTAGSG